MDVQDEQATKRGPGVTADGTPGPAVPPGAGRGTDDATRPVVGTAPDEATGPRRGGRGGPVRRGDDFSTPWKVTGQPDRPRCRGRPERIRTRVSLAVQWRPIGASRPGPGDEIGRGGRLDDRRGVSPPGVS